MSSHLSPDERETIRRFVIAQRRRTPHMSERRLYQEFIQAHTGWDWVGLPRFRYHVNRLKDEAKQRGVELQHLPLPGEGAHPVTPSAGADRDAAAQMDRALRWLDQLEAYRRQLVAALGSVDRAVAEQQALVGRLVRGLTTMPEPAGEPHGLSPLPGVEDRAAGPSEETSLDAPSALGLALALGAVAPGL